MRIAITGALGHIGSRLARELAAGSPSTEVLLLDNLATQRYASLFGLPANCQFAQVDVTAPGLERLLAGCSTVVHLAAMTDAAGSVDRAAEVERNNFHATVGVAQAAAACGAAVIHLSSTSVYGTQSTVVDEACGPEDLKPQSPYAETKLREEAWLQQEAPKLGLRFITCRFGTIAGTSPGMRFHTAVNKFCWQAAMGQPVTVWRTAMHQKRPYLELGDACAAIGHILRADLFDGRIYNILTANHTVDDIVTAIRQHVPTLEVRLVDERIMNQLSYEVLDARIRATGWAPRGSIRTAITQTLELLGQRAPLPAHSRTATCTAAAP
ncbi:MAG: SDR family oxidoreductase [Phycisphaerales bacterium]